MPRARKNSGMESNPSVVEPPKERRSAPGVILRALLDRREPMTSDELAEYVKEVGASPLDMSIDDGVMILVDGGIARAAQQRYDTVELTPEFREGIERSS